MQVRVCSGYLKPQYSGEELRAMAMERRRKAVDLVLNGEDWTVHP